MQTRLTFNIPESRDRRDKGILQAVTHADKVNTGWSEKAYTMFKDWLNGWAQGHKFLMEDFRISAHIRGLPDPPSNRAFGQIAVRARKAGLIKSNGQRATRSVTAHRCFASEWVKV